MIKSLLGEDENTEKKESPENKGDKQNSTQNSLLSSDDIKTQDDVKTENVVVDTPNDEIETIDEIKTAIETEDIPSKLSTQDASKTVQPFEINKPIGQPIVERKPVNEKIQDEHTNEIVREEKTESTKTLELEKKLREIEEELKKEKELEVQRLNEEVTQKVKAEQPTIQQVESISDVEVETVDVPKQELKGDWSDWNKSDEVTEDKSIQIKPKDFVPETNAEGIRKSGMAWSAAIALFGSVVFMLVLGWGADLLLGSEPWGIVGGIVIGSIIGFIQFFRTTSQILKPKPSDFDRVSLKTTIEASENEKVKELTEKIADESEVKNENKKENADSENSLKEIVNEAEMLDGKTETIVNTDVK